MAFIKAVLPDEPYLVWEEVCKNMQEEHPGQLPAKEQDMLRMWVKRHGAAFKEQLANGGCAGQTNFIDPNSSLILREAELWRRIREANEEKQDADGVIRDSVAKLARLYKSSYYGQPKRK
jgi:hypothetical protein